MILMIITIAITINVFIIITIVIIIIIIIILSPGLGQLRHRAGGPVAKGGEGVAAARAPLYYL